VNWSHNLLMRFEQETNASREALGVATQLMEAAQTERSHLMERGRELKEKLAQPLATSENPAVAGDAAVLAWADTRVRQDTATITLAQSLVQAGGRPCNCNGWGSGSRWDITPGSRRR
jgi:hypothetical protein